MVRNPFEKVSSVVGKEARRHTNTFMGLFGCCKD